MEEPVPWELDLDEWWRVFETNVLGVMRMTRSLLPRLVAHPTESYGMRITDPSGAVSRMIGLSTMM